MQNVETFQKVLMKVLKVNLVLQLKVTNTCIQSVC